MANQLQSENKTRADRSFMSAPSSLLQRKCACGNHTMAGGECDKCKKQSLKRASLSPRGRGAEGEGRVPPIVHEVLRSPGKPLDVATRDFMEPRFRYDFSQVQLHTDTRAVESANAINALAYTVGRHIVLDAQQSSLSSAAGRELLAHELAHVVQQEHVSSDVVPTQISQPFDPGEVNADHLSRAALADAVPSQHILKSSSPALSRRVIPRLVHCTAGSDGAPADHITVLTSIVDRAEGMATAASFLLTLVAALTRAGLRPVGSTVEQAFDDRFGEPPAVGGGFLNRLTGAVRPTLEVALSEEMDLMARRYELISNQFGSGFIHYLCMSTTRSFGGCNITDCSNDAWACPGVNAIFLCPGFWGGDLRTSSTLLIHETTHMIWENVFHGARGTGGNFRHAECYASFVSDIFGLTPGGPPCPVI